jgi:hypothetical protein
MQVQRAKEEKSIRNVGDKVEPASALARVYKGAIPPVVINALNISFVNRAFNAHGHSDRLLLFDFYPIKRRLGSVYTILNLYSEKKPTNR